MNGGLFMSEIFMVRSGLTKKVNDKTTLEVTFDYEDGKNWNCQKGYYVSTTFWGNLKGDEVTPYDVLACLQKYPCDDYEDFCNDYGFDIYDDFEGGYNKQSRKIWKACVNEYAKVEKLFSEEELDALREIA